MAFDFKINYTRRLVMNKLTRKIGESYSEPEYGSLKPGDIKEVLIIRTNHRLGNILLLTPLVQEVINTFPNCKITLFVKGGVAHPIFENYKEVVKFIKLPRKPWSNIIKYISCWLSIKRNNYDLVINAVENSSSGRLLTNLSNSKIKVFGEEHSKNITQYSDNKHFAKKPVYNFRLQMDKIGIKSQLKTPAPVLDIKLKKHEISVGSEKLKAITKNDKKTICIYTNATGTKIYSESWWDSFYKKLLKEYPEYNIIEMLPVENISKINFKAPHFYSKDLREMAAIIKNTDIFIAADNGVMHLASAALVPCLGLFRSTNKDTYGPYGNGSVAINTNATTIDDWFLEVDNILKLSK